MIVSTTAPTGTWSEVASSAPATYGMVDVSYGYPGGTYGSLRQPLAPDTLTLFSRLGWAADEDTTGTLRAWLDGMGQTLQVIDNIARDELDSNGIPAPGWSQILDVNRCPTQALPWLGQFVGVAVDPTLSDSQQRFLIESTPGFGRGTLAAIQNTANYYLSGGFTASIVERDTSAYHLAINIPKAAVPYATCQAVANGFATCAALAVAFPTCASLIITESSITAAVSAAVPAGLVAAISYV